MIMPRMARLRLLIQPLCLLLLPRLPVDGYRGLLVINFEGAVCGHILGWVHGDRTPGFSADGSSLSGSEVMDSLGYG